MCLTREVLQPHLDTWHLVGMYDLMCHTREILQPRPSMFDLVFLTRKIRQTNPDISRACLIWCLEPVFLTREIQQPHLDPYPWDHAALSWYPAGKYDMVFRTREILQPRPDTL